MATVGELKVNVILCGGPELAHLLAMLEANVENLPIVVVKAMKAFADPNRDKNVSVAPLSISGWVCAEEFKSALRVNNFYGGIR